MAWALLVVGAPAVAAPSPWSALATADVERLHRSVVDYHAGIRDPDTPDFGARVEAAYAKASARAAKAASYADWLDATQGFMLSFRDGHAIFRPTLAPARVRWPGFLIDGRGDGWVVRRPAGFESSAARPADGARIVACDGVPIADLLKARLDGVSADWSKAPERIRQAFRLFLDARPAGKPPVATCTFEDNGATTAVDLTWTEEDWPKISASLAPFTRRAKRGIGMRTLASGGVWIGLGSFGRETELNALLSDMKAKAADLRRAPFVVLDLRDNAGGNSTWGESLAAAIWGDAAVDARSAQLDARPGLRAGKFFRGTPQVAQRQTGARSRIGAGLRKVAGYWRQTAERLASAPGGDETLVHDPCCDASPSAAPPPDRPSLYAGPVYALIDAGCFSSCVVAAGRLVAQGATAVGETSGQNEEYGEIVEPPPLPSGLARYFLPISIIRQPKEALRVEPAIAWSGAMDDDAGLEAWISRLAAGPRRDAKR